jgi:PAS domain S-box-containing protein
MLPTEGNRGWRQRRDLRVTLLELYGLFVGTVLIGALIFNALARDRLKQDAIAADVVLAERVASAVVHADFQDTPQLESWLEIATARRTLMVIVFDSEAEILSRSSSGLPPMESARLEGWQLRAMRVATNSGDSGSFSTSTPDGEDWLHAFASIPSTEYWILVQRPVDSVFNIIQAFERGLLLAAIFFVVGGIFFWWALSRRVISPLEKLEMFSGLIHWRGQLHREEQSDLRQLGKRPDQMGSLALSLAGMAQGVEERHNQLATLLATSRIVAASLDLSEVMDNILAQLQRQFEVDRCAIVALDTHAGVFRIRASRGLTGDYVKQLRIAPSEPMSAAMRALRNQAPVQISDTETDLAFAQLRSRAKAEGFRSVLAIPLSSHYSPPAVLLLYKAHPYRYSYGELELASSFANHASIAMENATLHALTDKRLQEQKQQLEAIVEGLNDGLILESLTGQMLYCNRQALAMVGRRYADPAALRSRELMEGLLSTAGEAEEVRAALKAAIQGQGQQTVDLSRRLEDGRVQDLRIHLFDVNDTHGEQIGRGQLWQDISRDKEIDRAKSALLATVSHELRTPLAAIKGYATTLLAKDVEWDETAQKEFLQTISQQADQLARLVSNLLDMSRLEAGTLSTRRELHSLEVLVKEAVSKIQPACVERLRLRLPPDIPLIWVDASHVQTVIRNLLENAMKYGPPEARIELTAGRENGQLLVRVRDYGPGIPESMRDRVFERFFRGSNRSDRESGGVGLGLAICKGFIEAHGGQVWVENGHPGAIFSFTLPADNLE